MSTKGSPTVKVNTKFCYIKKQFTWNFVNSSYDCPSLQLEGYW